MAIKKKGKRKKVSPFPSPQTYVKRNFTHSSEIYSSGRSKKRMKVARRQRRRRPYRRQRPFTESPLRRDLRIKQSIEQSIKSHINRLADYRRDSMLKCDSLPYLQVASKSLYSMNPCASSVCSTKASVCRQKPVNAVVVRRPLPRRKHKKIKEQVIRTEELDNGDFEGYCFDTEVKKISESVQSFEKIRKEFLSGLEKVHAQVSSLRLPLTAEEMTMSKQSLPSINRSKNVTPTQSTHGKGNTKSKKRSRPVSAKVSKQELKIVRENVVDNLSKMLMNTSQRPKTKTPSNIPTTLQKAMGVGLQKAMGGLGGGNSSGAGSGLMNLAFCSMAGGFT